MDLQELIKWQLSDNFINSLGKESGIEDPNKAQAAADGIINTLLLGLNKNAQSEQGASALANALERDHDGSVLDDMFGLLVKGNSQPQNSNKMLDGMGILSHILGSKQSNVFGTLSNGLGISNQSMLNMAAKLAPFVLGVLGRTKQRNNMGINDLTNILGSTVRNINNNPNQANKMSILEKLLDSNNDGNSMDDIAKIGMNIFGSLLKR